MRLINIGSIQFKFQASFVQELSIVGDSFSTNCLIIARVVIKGGSIEITQNVIAIEAIKMKPIHVDKLVKLGHVALLLTVNEINKGDFRP